jgi:hypothetical protein
MKPRGSCDPVLRNLDIKTCKHTTSTSTVRRWGAARSTDHAVLLTSRSESCAHNHGSCGHRQCRDPLSQGTPGIKGDKGDPGSANLRLVQGDGAVTCEANETLVSVFCPNGGAPDGAKCGTTPSVGLCMRK